METKVPRICSWAAHAELARKRDLERRRYQARALVFRAHLELASALDGVPRVEALTAAAAVLVDDEPTFVKPKSMRLEDASSKHGSNGHDPVSPWG